MPEDLPPSQLELIQAQVEKTYAKHIAMQDPKLIALSVSAAYYKDGGKREFDRDSLPGLRKSLSYCHDVNKKLIVANDDCRIQIFELCKALAWERTWRWSIVAGLIITFFASVILHFVGM